MKYIETLASWYNSYPYQIDRITYDSNVNVVLRNLSKHPYGVVCYFSYEKVDYKLDCPMMRWENVIRCSNYCLAAEEKRCTDTGVYVPGYMLSAVQNGLKPAATIRFEYESEESQSIINQLPQNCVGMRYVEENSLFICRRGTLSNIYDIDEVKAIYSLYGIQNVDWDIVKKYCEKDISWFANSNESGIWIESGACDLTDYIIIGLLLGYPIESTVSYLKNTFKIFFTDMGTLVRDHFKNSKEHYIDGRGQEWVNENDHVYIMGQQESLFY